MSLTDILSEAIERVNGVELSGIVGTDGLGVEMLLLDEDLGYEREDAEAELSWLVSAVATTAQQLGSGTVLDVVVEAEELTYLASFITPGYYAVLGIRPDGNLGRARFAVRQMVNRLRNEL